MRNSIKALCVAGMSLAMASPAFGAAQIYSSIRYDTFYITQKSDGATNAASDDSVTQLYNGLAANSRIGVKFSEGSLSGQWEMGLPGSNTRLAYGKYDFNNSSSMLIGQTYNPWTMFSDQVWGADNGNIGFGALYDGRQPQVKFTFSGFYLAAVTTHNGVKFDADNVQYTQIPKIGVGYDGKAGNATFGAGFAYNTYKEQNDAINFDEDINSYLTYARFSVKFAPVTVKAQVHYGQNLGDFGISGRSYSIAYRNSTGGVDNTDSYGGFVQVGATMTPMISMNVGAGYTRDELDNVDVDQTTVFVNFPIKIAEHFHVVPEFDYFHYDPATGSPVYGIPASGLPNSEDIYIFGAKWQMDF